MPGGIGQVISNSRSRFQLGASLAWTAFIMVNVICQNKITVYYHTSCAYATRILTDEVLTTKFVPLANTKALFFLVDPFEEIQVSKRKRRKNNGLFDMVLTGRAGHLNCFKHE